MEDDLLYTNKFIGNNAHNAGYGMTEEIRRFKLRSHIEKREIVLPDAPQSEHVLPGDILKTNPVIDDDYQLRNLKSGSKTIEKRDVFHISSADRTYYELVYIGGLLGADDLNNAFVPTATDYYRPYIDKSWSYIDSNGTQISGNVQKIVHKYQNPSRYKLELPSIKHIKSIRLLSSEIPNVYNNINAKNNLIILSIRNSSGVIVPYNTTLTDFPFIIVQLEIGYYQTVDSLISHMEEKLNIYASTYTNPPLPADLFIITYNAYTGKITIGIRPTYIGSYDFHIKFYFTTNDDGILVDSNNQLWHMLGFPWPYEIDNDGTDLYYTETNNIFDYGLHPLVANNYDLQNNLATNVDLVAAATAQSMTEIQTEFNEYKAGTDSSTNLDILRPYRIPNIDYNTCIFMTINDISHVMSSIDFSGSGRFDPTNNNYFAKILMNVDHGLIAYNTYVDSPHIYYEQTLSLLDHLEIIFYDMSGNVVDFGGIDNSFTLEVIHYVDVLEINNYDTQRGNINITSIPESLYAGDNGGSQKNLINSSFGL